MTTHSTSDSLDLFAIAHQAMIDAGFVPDFPQAVSQELLAIESSSQLLRLTAKRATCALCYGRRSITVNLVTSIRWNM